MTQEEKDKNQQLYNEFLKEYKRVRFNPVYFMEKYYNAQFPDKVVIVDDEDRQNIYDHYRGVPLLKDASDMRKLSEEKKRRLDKGLKDWEYED